MTNTKEPSPSRQTKQRAIIWDHLGQSTEFLTAQQIHDQLRATGAPVSLPTIYRTVATMVEAGDLDTLTTDGQAAYRRCSAHHHHHLVCRVCLTTIEVTGTGIEQWITQIGAQYGYSDLTHLMEFTGTCPDCRQN
ncbi:MAG: transcriptional repressor [Propionibacteriaceae bacterium]|jgi:Fur family ferric uptake transcriptional regulator|nr:transcriptional repressor [Propionibacteriaceae bacterium]